MEYFLFSLYFVYFLAYTLCTFSLAVQWRIPQSFLLCLTQMITSQCFSCECGFCKDASVCIDI